MKLKFISLIIALVTSFNLFAQDEHLEFQGISLDGKMRRFESRLYEKGFKDSPIRKGAYVGKFINEDVSLLPLVSVKTDRVYGISISLMVSKDWAQLKSKIDDVAALFEKKYGKPTERTDKYTEGASYKGGGYEIHNLSTGSYFYSYKWITRNGTITISANATIRDGGYITIDYLDRANSEIVEREKLEDI